MRILSSVKPGHDIRPIGVDIELGKLIVAKGSRLGPPEVGLLAAVGITRVKVVDLPKLAILSTGDEVSKLASLVTSPSI